MGAGRRINHPQEVVSVGDKVEATVLSVDMEKQRIGLSLNTERQNVESVKPNLAKDYGKPKEGFGTLGDLLKESMKKQKK
jgi:small subunit ribosomal protein S1